MNDFDIAEDVVQLHGTGITSFAEVLAAATDHGSFSIITLDANTAIWLVGVAPAQYTPTNFQFS